MGKPLEDPTPCSPLDSDQANTTAAFAPLTDGGGCRDAVPRCEHRATTLVTAQSALLEQIASDTPLAVILEELMRGLEREVDGLLCSILLLRDGRLWHGAAPSLPAAYQAAIEGVVIGPSVGSCGTAAFTGKPVFVGDIASDPLWRDYRDLALEHGLRACWSTPICTSKGEVLGTFAMYHRTIVDAPSERDQELVRVATHIARIAIEHARTREALRLRTEALLDADRLKDEFLAILAHELRNPMAPIVAAVQLLDRPDCSEEVVRKVGVVIARQARTLNRLIDELLDVSRITRGKIQLECEVMTAQAAVAQALEIAQPLMKQRHHEVQVTLPPEPLSIEADPIRLVQVLSNILSNAGKYTDPGGRITVEARARRDGPENKPVVDFIIRDNGIGIPPEHLDHIFDLFVQAPRGLAQARGGLGIGLTLVKRLVELHGGRVEARSAGTGQGSEFVVTLPAHRARPPERAAESADAAPATAARSTEEPGEVDVHQDAEGQAKKPGDRRRILIVDDNEDAAQMLGDALELSGFDVRTAVDGPSGLAILNTWVPDVVLLDIGLPGMDGYEVAQRIRATASGARLRLCALTGFGQASARARSEAAGFDVHLVKPVDIKLLIREIS